MVKSLGSEMSSTKQFVEYKFEVQSPAGITFEICDRYSNIENFLRSVKSSLGMNHAHVVEMLPSMPSKNNRKYVLSQF